ncbi:helix-turn-helix domain-containing protein [Streptomyces naphthomycinicus]|uniref:helix-turn-helix domain-containing protein n=1 Tax=Streptomyces naphthomycinicus TaxID=2872625 RepID=UPI001CED58E8|nr:helix-turn-helix domain-containing protein [Streptomyces sp. TML10]
MRQEVLRAFQFALDPTPVQVEALIRHAGAARWAFNHAHGMKVAAHQQWRREVQALVDQGVPEAEARKKVRVPVPSKPQIQKHLNQIKGDSRIGGLPKGVYGPERPCPWWREVNTYATRGSRTRVARGKRSGSPRTRMRVFAGSGQSGGASPSCGRSLSRCQHSVHLSNPLLGHCCKNPGWCI